MLVRFGSIDDHRVRLDFHTGPATCTVLLVSKATDLPDPSAAPTFEEAIQVYPWAVVVDVLELD